MVIYHKNKKSYKLLVFIPKHNNPIFLLSMTMSLSKSLLSNQFKK